MYGPEPRPIFHHNISGCIFCFVALVILVPMVVSPSQIVWAQAQTQQHSEHLKYDAPSQKQVSVPDVAQ